MLKTEVFDMDKKEKPKRGFALRPFIRAMFMLKTEVFDMDKKKKPKRGFALRPSLRTIDFILDAV